MENKTQSSKYLKGPQKKYNNLHRIGQDCSEQEKKKSALQSAEWLVLHLITRRPQIFFCRPTWQPKVLFIVVVHNLIARVLKHVRWNQTTKIKASLNLAGCCIYKNDLSKLPKMFCQLKIYHCKCTYAWLDIRKIVQKDFSLYKCANRLTNTKHFSFVFIQKKLQNFVNISKNQRYLCEFSEL